MKHRIRKLTSLLLSLSLISALTLPAAASNALGEDLSAKDTLLHQETQLSTNVFWSTTYSDLRTENLITYTPNKAVTPIVTYGDALTDRSSVADMAALLEEDGYRVVAGINGDFYNVSTGLPIGMVVTEGLLRSSDAGYYAIGFRADSSAILGKPGVKVSANLGYAVDDGFGNSTKLVRPVAAVNKARTNSGLYLYTYDFNAKHTTGTTEPGINVVCPRVPGFVSGLAGFCHQSFEGRQFLRRYTVICRHQHQPLSHGAGCVWHDADDLLLSAQHLRQAVQTDARQHGDKNSVRRRNVLRQLCRHTGKHLGLHSPKHESALPQDRFCRLRSAADGCRRLCGVLRRGASHGHRRPAHGFHRCPRQRAAHISSADKTGLILICHTSLLTGSVRCPE